jgi:hypothetical protein
VKSEFPTSQVKVIVDANNCALKVFRREKKQGTPNRWDSYERSIPLPRLALNTEIRKVPDGFVMEYLPPSKDKGLSGSPEKNVKSVAGTVPEEVAVSNAAQQATE